MQKAKFKKFIFGFLTIIFVISLGIKLFPIKMAQCQVGGSVGVTNPPVEHSTKMTWRETIKKWMKNFLMWTSKWKKEDAFSLAFKEALGNFLNQLAYDTANYLAAGDKGQSPMFYTDSLGDYLKNAADNAAGKFLEELGRKGAFGAKFNLCEPDLNVKVKIGLGMAKKYRPRKPACTFSEMKKNWENELKRRDFLNRFQDMFNPWSNDLGVALSLQSGISETVSRKENISLQEFLKNSGFKDVAEDISGAISTPGVLVKEQAKKVIEGSTDKERVFTGNIVADAIDVFYSTLVGRLMESWLKKGLVTHFPDYSYKGDWGGFRNYEAGSSGGGGMSAAKERFRSLIEPQFGVRGDYNILSELTTCSDPTKAGPTNCVITDNFRQAINEKKTVIKAIEEGYLNPDGVFGFTVDGFEPSYMEGYPYRSMIILRKFRIIPVGWELAAQYIKNHPTETGTCNLGDIVACFDQNDSYNYNSGSCRQGVWCRGLVDPFWVLKAPLNYCRREGPGPEIISEQISGQDDDSELSITRNDNYCADEQTCIQENNDGSCNLYGYCTEERRKWQFNGRSCEPKYNTCQTFRSRDGRTVSYLENTLDYRYCNAENAGCQAYCEDYDYVTGQFTCDEDLTGTNDDNYIFLDKDVEECDASAEGCHRFIRTRPGLGVNLLRNASFEEIGAGDMIDDGAADIFSYWGAIGEAVSDSYDGTIGLQLTGSLNQTVIIGPSDYTLEGQEVTLSFYAKNCVLGDNFVIFGQATATPLQTDNSWNFYQTTYMLPKGVATNQVDFTINSANCIIDAIKLERGGQATGFVNYGEKEVIYEKLAPDYLGCSGAVSDPPECKNFVRFCQADEVGCNMYIGNDGINVPARVTAQDYCPAECVGYDYYLQTETNFDSYRENVFIPQTAKACSAASVGCDEFTNLDKLGQGAEAREYYSHLKQCIKPDDSAANCVEFYTWEGSAETGYQLRVFNLQADIGGAPVLSNNGYYDGQECNDAADYNLATNPMCREFYDKNGAVHYAFYPYIITCSNNCHPYRRTETNILDTLAEAQTLCLAENPANNCSNATCDSSASNGAQTCQLSDGRAVFCKNGGVWRSDHQACIYMAIPDEGIRCSASAAGCRKYTGSRGSNMRLVLYNDFEGSLQDWQGDIDLAQNPSTNALGAGGHSLFVSDYDGDTQYIIQKNLGDVLYPNSSYVIKFIAQAASPPVTLNISFSNGTATTSFTGAAVLNGEWNVYELNMSALGEVGGPGVVLKISGTGEFYIDDIRLIEITDSYYLIKNSWQTPNNCNFDDIGCDIYHDREDETYYLHSFSRLCDEEAIGCELMIDTENYTLDEGDIWNDNDGNNSCDIATEPACEKVDEDNYRYVVYNQNKICDFSDQGCQLVGRPYKVENNLLYQAVYLKNNPDKYKDILCNEDEEGCEEWTYNEGIKYFKDPGDQVCQWRQTQGDPKGSWGWYKKKIKRCDNGVGGGTADNGVIETSMNPITGQLEPVENTLCFSDDDCGDYKCILDENDYLCTIDWQKTIGWGGNGNRVDQPGIDSFGYWAGICPAAQSGCAEYIDPLSQFSTNIIFNSDFSQDVDVNSVPDGWHGSSQDIRLEPYTLYRLAGQDDSGNTLTLNCQNSLLWLNPITNSLENINGGSNSISLAIPASSNPVSVLVYSNDNSNDCSVNVSGLHGRMELRKAIIDYQLKQSVDRASCNGVVNRDTGCVLFNERAQVGENKASLIWDTDLTIDDGEGISPQHNSDNNQQDVNILLKVSPDRVCSKWLSCRSFVKDENDQTVCLGIGLCDNADKNGICTDFVVNNQTPVEKITSDSGEKYSNISGYVKVGLKNVNDENMQGLYPLAAMKQLGNAALVVNGGFEITGKNGYPIGWKLKSTENTVWKESYFKVINNPVAAQKEGVGYAPEGKSFLRAGKEHVIESDSIDIEGGVSYSISAYLNTINVSGGIAQVGVSEYNSDNVFLSRKNLLQLKQGEDWQFKSAVFTPANSASKIKIELELSGSKATGNYYVDEIKIMPELEVRPGKYIPQTCRLYPKDDSLSCDYFEYSGKRQKGWWGYCLEYDRYPGNEDACLLWWPIDRVKGDGIGGTNFGGYLGKFPLYYCANVDANFELIEHREEKLLKYKKSSGFTVLGSILHVTGSFPPFSFSPLALLDILDGDEKSKEVENSVNICPTVTNGGYHLRIVKKKKSGLLKKKVKIWVYCTPNEDDRVVGNWYRYNGNLIKFKGLDYGGWDETKDGVKIYDFTNRQIVNPSEYNINCYKIYQTVNSIGQNKTWLGRVYPDSEYKTRILNYGYETDNSPFGSIVPPQPVDNPYEWDGNRTRGIQPLFLLPEDSGAVRVGSPYACSGGKCGQLGRCSLSRTICLNVIQNKPQGVVKTCATNSGYMPCYINWKQSILPCPQGETCQTNLLDLANPAIPAPVENLKRLFAKSYGAWSWQGNKGYCANNPAQECTPENNQCPNGYCQSRCIMRYKGVVVGNLNDSGEIIPYRTCTYGSDNCNDITYGGETASTLNNNNSCRDFNVVCGSGGATCINNYCCDSPSYPGSSGCCGDSDNDGVDDCNPDCCSDDERQICVDYFTNAPPLGVAGQHVCSATFEACTSDSDCHNYESSCEWTTCVGGDRDEQVCTNAQACTNSYCILETTQAGRYKPIYGNSWDVPTTSCPENIRPSVFSPGDADYCAIIPLVKYIRVNNVAGINYNVYLSKSQVVNLTFNSIIDINQLPLTRIVVDWGDGDKTVISGIEMNSKPDIINPHSLYHLYSYWDLRARQITANSIYCADANVSTPINNAGSSVTISNPPNADYCVVKPKVKIKDNWGWCNARIDHNGNFLESPTTVNDCDQWQDFGSDTADPNDGWIIVASEQVSSVGGGTCSNECSIPGSKRCYGSIVQVCQDSDGDSCLEWTAQTDCSVSDQTCSGGKCINACSETCSGAIVYSGNNHNAVGCYPAGTYSSSGNGIFAAINEHCCGTDMCYLCPVGESWNSSTQHCESSSCLAGMADCDGDSNCECNLSTHQCYGSQCRLTPQIDGIDISPNPWTISNPGSGATTTVNIRIRVNNIEPEETPICSWCGDAGSCENVPCNEYFTTFLSASYETVIHTASVSVSYDNAYAWGYVQCQCNTGDNIATCIFTYTGNDNQGCLSDVCPAVSTPLTCP
jgi:hypothetical protein